MLECNDPKKVDRKRVNVTEHRRQQDGLKVARGFKFSRGKLTQTRMNTLAVVEIGEEAADLLIGLVKILVVRECDIKNSRRRRLQVAIYC